MAWTIIGVAGLLLCYMFRKSPKDGLRNLYLVFVCAPFALLAAIYSWVFVIANRKQLEEWEEADRLAKKLQRINKVLAKRRTTITAARAPASAGSASATPARPRRSAPSPDPSGSSASAASRYSPADTTMSTDAPPPPA